MSITRTLAAALAIAALGASAAQAQPADMHASTAIAAAKARQKQDLRSPDARDAAQNRRDAGTATQKQDLRSADARDAAQNPRIAGEPAPRALPGAPTWPSHPQVIAPAAKPAPVSSNPGVDWLPIAIGAGLSLLAMAVLVAFNNRRVRRLQRVRVTV